MGLAIHQEHCRPARTLNRSIAAATVSSDDVQPDEPMGISVQVGLGVVTDLSVTQYAYSTVGRTPVTSIQAVLRSSELAVTSGRRQSKITVDYR